MSMIFRFRMLSDENDSFLRDYEVMYDMNLVDFHTFICRDLHYDAATMVSFFTSDKEWNRHQEFTLIDMGHDIDEEGAPVAMEHYTLGQIIHRNNDRLIYQFDAIADRCYYLELTATIEADPKAKYPRTVASSCDPADQFAPEMLDGGSIFDEMLGDFADFEGDDNYDDGF